MSLLLAFTTFVPTGWKEIPAPPGIGGPSRCFRSLDGGLAAVTSDDEFYGKRWLHVSISRRARMPSYDDLAFAKRTLIGDEQVAYQVFPKASQHRNYHPHCLHLWAPIGHDPFPDPLGHRALAVAP